ncbi:MAG: DUF3592 domain-containing protein [Lachnospiraceae bacterium]|nr:DUF3592 domain-containing protein [Lachnospiraceae bacterium]
MTGSKIIMCVEIGLMFLGLIFLGISIGVNRMIAHKAGVCTYDVSATVIAVNESSSYNSMDHMTRVSWYPVYEYTISGKTVRAVSKVGGMKSSFQVGQKVNLKINPQNVEEFYNENDQTSLLQMVFGIVGLVLLAAGVVTVFVSKKILG